MPSLWEGVMNIIEVVPGLYRSRQPWGDDEFQQIKSLGIKTIIDLENEPGENYWEENACHHNGLDIYKAPMSGFWAPPEFLMGQIQGKILGSLHVGSPILVHCRHGEDRSGLVIGMFRRSQGWTKAQAWKEMIDYGFHWYLLGLTFYFWVE
jgi:tyrosine-protein phosphatase SIW14